MKKSSLALSSLATLLFALSCNQELVPSAKLDDGTIVFTVNDILTHSVETKATAVTSLSSFNVSAVTGSAGSETAVWTNASFTDAGESRYTGDKYWPLTNDNPYRFYASNATLSFAATGATVAVDTDTDVVCAYLGSPTYKGVNALTFEHIFARIGDVTVSAANGYTISDVSISITPKTSGTFNLLTGDGETDGTGWSATSNGSTYALANATPGTKSNDLYLIPGTYTLTATWTATRGEYSQTFTDRTYPIDIVSGKINSISTTLGGLAEDVVFSVSVTPWGSKDIGVDFALLNGHDYVDLGLRDSQGRKVLFATKNLGAEHEYDYGDRFAWGETQRRYTLSNDGQSLTEGSFNWNSYIFSEGANNTLTRYCTNASYGANGFVDDLSTLSDSDDPVKVQWGGGWQTPAPEHLQLLLNWTLVWNGWDFSYMDSGIQGRKFKGRNNFAGTEIFLPCGGSLEGTAVVNEGSNMEYWSNRLSDESPDKASYLKMTGTFGKVYEENGERYKGRCIRPVIVLD